VALEAAGHRSDVRAVALSSDDASLLSASSAAVKVRRSNISGAASWTAAPLLHSKLETCAWHKLVPGMNSACLHSGHTLLTRVVVGRAGVEPAHGRVHSHRGHRLRPVAAVGARQPPRRRRHKGEPCFLYILTSAIVSAHGAGLDAFLGFRHLAPDIRLPSKSAAAALESCCYQALCRSLPVCLPALQEETLVCKRIGAEFTCSTAHSHKHC